MIDEYTFGKIIINGTPYTSDIRIIRGRVFPDWWRERGHVVSVRDIEEILSAEPDVLVLGTGFYGAVKIDPPVKQILDDRDIRLIALKSGEAATELNRLADARANVAAGFHLSC